MEIVSIERSTCEVRTADELQKRHHKDEGDG